MKELHMKLGFVEQSKLQWLGLQILLLLTVVVALEDILIPMHNQVNHCESEQAHAQTHTDTC
jgi:hypothetical protein